MCLNLSTALCLRLVWRPSGTFGVFDIRHIHSLLVKGQIMLKTFHVIKISILKVFVQVSHSHIILQAVNSNKLCICITERIELRSSNVIYKYMKIIK